MRILTLVTNISQDRITESVIKNASKLIAGLFDESEQNVFISIKTEVRMAWGTKPGSFALGTIQSTEPFEAEDSKLFAPQVFEFVEKELQVPQNRMYLGFISINPDNIATDGVITSVMDES